jgi:hypothetical protein
MRSRPTAWFWLLALSIAIAAGCQQKGGDSPKAGKACHVVGGPNDGKEGRYDREGDCCDADESGDEIPGGWGCTSCGPGSLGKCEDGPKPSGGGSRFGALEVALADLPVKVDPGPLDPACPGPRPDNIGCTTLCKPCKIFLCIDGEWRAEDLPWPDGVCDGPEIDLGDDPFACPRSPEGFCPAECSFCF